MVIDFQHHYVPMELAKKRGLYSDKGEMTYLQEGGKRATTLHTRLYDLDLQLEEMAEAGIDVSVLSCLLGWNAPMDECQLINDDLARVQAKYPGKSSDSRKRLCWRVETLFERSNEQYAL
jgi:hypothetical protein